MSKKENKRQSFDIVTDTVPAAQVDLYFKAIFEDAVVAPVVPETTNEVETTTANDDKKCECKLPEYLKSVMDIRCEAVGGILGTIMKRHGTANGFIRMTEAGGAMQIILDHKRDWSASPSGNSNKNHIVKELIGAAVIRAFDAMFAEIQKAMNEGGKVFAEDLIKIGLTA